MSEAPRWLEIVRQDAPLVLAMPHTGTDIPPDFEEGFVSAWLARKDADWWIDRVYDFAPALGVTLIRTTLSRSLIDCNRDPSGRSLYPGQNTTELCPTITFDGEPLYREGRVPESADIALRRTRYFDPYHAAIDDEIDRLRKKHDKVVLFEAHSIRSRIPRLFEGELPQFNIGTNSGASCAGSLTAAIERVCDASSYTRVTNGRFKGGYTTRHHGRPEQGIHAVQLELAMRGYIDEPEIPTPENWPPAYQPARAAPLRAVLRNIVEICLEFASAS